MELFNYYSPLFKLFWTLKGIHKRKRFLLIKTKDTWKLWSEETQKCLWKIAGLMEDLFLGSQWSIILGYRRLSVKFLFSWAPFGQNFDEEVKSLGTAWCLILASLLCQVPINLFKVCFYLMVVSWHYIIIFFLCVSYFLFFLLITCKLRNT